MPAPLVLHDYWRSSAAFRVRIALNLKGLAHTAIPHDLRAGEHHAATYRTTNPQGLIPALEVGTEVLTQSLAILEWLEEVHPAPPLLPRDPLARAQVRALALAVACEIHPLQNLRTANRLREQFAAGSHAVLAWMQHWIAEGFDGIEPLLARHAGTYAHGNTPTMADICLVPQAWNAARYNVPLDPWPRLAAVVAQARAHRAFAAADPDHHPGAAP